MLPIRGDYGGEEIKGSDNITIEDIEAVKIKDKESVSCISLTDTHPWVWFLTASPHLSQKAKFIYYLNSANDFRVAKIGLP